MGQEGFEPSPPCGDTRLQDEKAFTIYATGPSVMLRHILNIAIMLVMSSTFFMPVNAAVDSLGVTTANECGGGWAVGVGQIAVSAWVTPDVANLQLDSGRFGIGDNYADPDTAIIVVYSNLNGEPYQLIATSDSCWLCTHYNCDMLCVTQFAQEALPQDDSVWIGIYMVGYNGTADMGIWDAGQGLFYDAGLGAAPATWLTEGDTWTANWVPSTRIYISTSTGETPGARRLIMLKRGL